MDLQDKIGRGEIVDKICGLVESMQKDQNFCLSLNGTWGSGKSFVLQMIEERLSKKPEYFIVKYDAWRNTFYHDPLIAMLYCILDSLGELAKDTTSQAKNMVKEVGKEITEAVTENTKVGRFIKIIKSIIEAYKKTAIINNAQTEEYKSYAAFLQETIKQLNEITAQDFYKDKQTKLIVLVDEIDRCLPDEQLKILERLHHLFDVKNCAVIVAMNQQSVSKTVRSLYGVDGYEYLRKFFDFTFKLETAASDYLKGLFDTFIENLKRINTANKQPESSVKFAYLCLLHGSNKALDKVDNRELTRYYDSLLNLCNDFGWEKLTPGYVFFILLGLYIRKNISSAFLNEREIIEKQQLFSEKRKFKSDEENRHGMPYFDYLNTYLGVDRDNLPEEFPWEYGEICSFSWTFNEMVFYSIDKQVFIKNRIFDLRSKPKVVSEDCQELRRLIVFYGGEQERNATNER